MSKETTDVQFQQSISLQIAPALKVDVIRKRIKHMYLSVLPPAGTLRLTVPLYASDKKIRQFVLSKQGWIHKHVRKFSGYTPKGPILYGEAEEHYFQGKCYTLNIVERNAPPKVSLQYLESVPSIILYIQPRYTFEQKQRLMRGWYRAELHALIPIIVKKWEEIIGVRIRDWRVRHMKTRWGTCNIQAKRIWLNLELAKYPLCCLEYVVVHEILHLIERHHNARFHALMDRYMPEWRTHKETLENFSRAIRT